MIPIYLQIFLWLAAFLAFALLAVYLGGLAVRQACFKIIAELEEARAFKESRSIYIQDERKNIFRVGTGNIRPKALNILIADKLVIKTSGGRYYLDKANIARMKAQLKADS